MTGATAYFGLLDIGKPQPGETVVVSAAAGAVGSIVGQIAKLKGCRVVGIAGSDEKCRHVVQDFGFDACINYKKENVEAALKRECPNGIDVDFQNAGGTILEAVLNNLNLKARIVLCGMIADYNTEGPIRWPVANNNILMKRARVRRLHHPRLFPAAQRNSIADMMNRGWPKGKAGEIRRTCGEGYRPGAVRAQPALHRRQYRQAPAAIVGGTLAPCASPAAVCGDAR